MVASATGPERFAIVIKLQLPMLQPCKHQCKIPSIKTCKKKQEKRDIKHEGDVKTDGETNGKKLEKEDGGQDGRRNEQDFKCK